MVSPGQDGVDWSMRMSRHRAAGPRPSCQAPGILRGRHRHTGSRAPPHTIACRHTLRVGPEPRGAWAARSVYRSPDAKPCGARTKVVKVRVKLAPCGALA